MAEAASNAVTFDILDGIILESDDTILDNLTEEVFLEVTNVVTLLESAEEDSLQHFELDQNTASAACHKSVCNDKLDWLASKTVPWQLPTRLNGLLH